MRSRVKNFNFQPSFNELILNTLYLYTRLGNINLDTFIHNIALHRLTYINKGDWRLSLPRTYNKKLSYYSEISCICVWIGQIIDFFMDNGDN